MIIKLLWVHSRDRAFNHKTQFGEWKIGLLMLVKFISLKDSGETRIMSICSDNIEIIMGSEIDDVIMNFLNLFCKIIKKVQNKQMRGNEFVLDSADLLYYHLHKISLKRGKSYIDSHEWLKNIK